MKWLRQRVLRGELITGVWCNLGSSLTAEIAGLSGFDWVLMDLEHGAGGEEALVHQLQALGGTPASAVVRIDWNNVPRFKRVLDLGAHGVMVPYVNNAREAEQAVAAMRYPPRGIRGVAKLNRASGFGLRFDEYFEAANENLLTVVQIETESGVEHAEEIASVQGVDVLFIGPLDLSVNLGVPQQLDHPMFRSAVSQVVSACRRNGKAAGTLLLKPEQVEQTIEDGFTFIALGSDGGMVAAGMRKAATGFDPYRKKK